ncbi:MAG: prolyl-tRNA synthetase associated domain-containing protein [Chloroflexi bacterium]|nr:prolyl-tRNA synthetase associated domain-containing protein [Chloroflexota bacterium]
MLTENELLEFLDTHAIAYQRFEHPAVFTCAEAELHRSQQPAVSTKNLFLCDKKGRRFFLVVTACEKTMDLLSLGEQIGVPRLRFASEENLARLLGVTRGSVTMLGLVNDNEHQVELWLDAEIWEEELFQSHPLVNTATLLLSRKTLQRFFEISGHSIHLLKT